VAYVAVALRATLDPKRLSWGAETAPKRSNEKDRRSRTSLTDGPDRPFSVVPIPHPTKRLISFLDLVSRMRRPGRSRAWGLGHGGNHNGRSWRAPCASGVVAVVSPVPPSCARVEVVDVLPDGDERPGADTGRARYPSRRIRPDRLSMRIRSRSPRVWRGAGFLREPTGSGDACRAPRSGARPMWPRPRRPREDARLVPAAGLVCAVTAFRIGFARLAAQGWRHDAFPR
jgi:hypothetical protein